MQVLHKGCVFLGSQTDFVAAIQQIHQKWFLPFQIRNSLLELGVFFVFILQFQYNIIVDFRKRIFQSRWKVKICLAHGVHLFFLFHLLYPVAGILLKLWIASIFRLTQIILQTEGQEQVCNPLLLPFSVYRSIPFDLGRSGASSSGASSISALSF